MAILGRFIKQPAEVLDYEFDFSVWLADRTDTISGVPTVTATPLTTGGATPLTISNISHTAGVVRFFASSGSNEVKYEITCTFTTSATPSRTKQDEMIIYVKEQ